jgi:hypothetical protein
MLLYKLPGFCKSLHDQGHKLIQSFSHNHCIPDTTFIETKFDRYLNCDDLKHMSRKSKPGNSAAAERLADYTGETAMPFPGPGMGSSGSGSFDHEEYVAHGGVTMVNAASDTNDLDDMSSSLDEMDIQKDISKVYS